MNSGFKADQTITSSVRHEIAAMHLQMSSQETPQLVSKLVKNYSRLVHKQVHLLKTKTNEPYEDLFQVGCMGLITALRKFDVNRKVTEDPENSPSSLPRSVSFTSFAVPYIKGNILHYLRDKSSMVRVPRAWHEIYSKYRSLSQSQVCKSEAPNAASIPVVTDIASLLNVSQEELSEIRLACENRTVTKELSFDIPDDACSATDIDEQVIYSNSCISSLKTTVLKPNLLTDEEHRAIEKCYLQQMSLVKAARISRTTPSKVKVLLHQALDKIAFNDNKQEAGG